MVRLVAQNTSILQFFNPKGPPLQKLETENRVIFGDLGSKSGVKGQGEEVKFNLRAGLEEKCINTNGTESQASLCVELLDPSDQLRKVKLIPEEHPRNQNSGVESTRSDLIW